MFCCCLVISFFINREISAVSRPIAAKLCHILEMSAILKTSPKVGGPQKIRGRIKLIFRRIKLIFGAISDDFATIDREYLQNGTRYR